MAKTFHLEIVTPYRLMDCGEVEYVRAPSTDGLFGVMARHTTAMITLDVGEIKYLQNGKPHYLATNGGFAEIRPENVQLLLETAERAHEIDRDRAEEAAEHAREQLRHARANHVDHVRARALLQNETNRLKVAARDLG